MNNNNLLVKINNQKQLLKQLFTKTTLYFALRWYSSNEDYWSLWISSRTLKINYSLESELLLLWFHKFMFPFLYLFDMQREQIFWMMENKTTSKK